VKYRVKYVGDEGVVALYYAAIKGCLPEIAFYRAFGEHVPSEVRREVILDVEALDLEDKGALCGVDSMARYREYRSKLLKEVAF